MNLEIHIKILNHAHNKLWWDLADKNFPFISNCLIYTFTNKNVIWPRGKNVFLFFLFLKILIFQVAVNLQLQLGPEIQL